MPASRRTILLLSGVAVLGIAMVVFVWMLTDRDTGDLRSKQSELPDGDAFSVHPTDEETLAEIGDEEEPEGPRLALVGTVVASDHRWSRASITDRRSGKTRVYRVGEPLPNGAKLVAIRSSRVVTIRDGRREVLVLDKQGRVADRPASTTEGIRPLGGNRFRIEREALNRYLDSAEEHLREARITLAFDPARGIEGLRLDLTVPDTLFEHIGLESGDLIHRIGSVVVDGPERMGEIGELLRNARELDVELTRAGKLMTLRYFVD